MWFGHFLLSLSFRTPNASHTPCSKFEQMMEDIEIVNSELELGGISKKPTIICNVDE